MGRAEADKELDKMLRMLPHELDAYFKALPPDGTSTKLVDDLLAKPPCPARDAIIKRAREFWYDDFRTANDEVLCPKMALHEDLTRAGYHDLASAVTLGKYDRA